MENALEILANTNIFVVFEENSAIIVFRMRKTILIEKCAIAGG